MTQDDVDTTKLILEGSKTPVDVKGKDPFYWKRELLYSKLATPKFIIV
jgi:hypothetical protein